MQRPLEVRRSRSPVRKQQEPGTDRRHNISDKFDFERYWTEDEGTKVPGPEREESLRTDKIGGWTRRQDRRGVTVQYS